MNKSLNTPNNAFQQLSSYKDKQLTELKMVKDAFFDRPKTMKEVDNETGIMRENICWYCRTLRLQEQLYPVEQRRCSVTKYSTVWAYTTNPDLVPEPSQLSLF